MSKSTVLVGLKEADRAIKRLPDYVQFEAQAAATTTAVNVAGAASSHAPRSTRGSHGHTAGFLASSIHWRADKGISAIVGIARAAFYWKFLEYGTRKMSAHPFLRPAADAERSAHFTRMLAGLTRAKDRMLNGQ